MIWWQIGEGGVIKEARNSANESVTRIADGDLFVLEKKVLKNFGPMVTPIYGVFGRSGREPFQMRYSPPESRPSMARH